MHKDWLTTLGHILRMKNCGSARYLLYSARYMLSSARHNHDRARYAVLERRSPGNRDIQSEVPCYDYALQIWLQLRTHRQTQRFVAFLSVFFAVFDFFVTAFSSLYYCWNTGTLM